jgi:hypothetical protein
MEGRALQLNLLKQLWKWGSGVVIGLLVVAYIATLLVHNVSNLYREAPDKDLKRYSDNALTALGTSQQWNMFAPNVGTHSYSPVVVIVMKDGGRIVLHSIVEPDTPNWTEPFLIPADAGADVRAYDWRFHIGDGRIRKYESRAASAEFAQRRIRTIYARFRAQEWIARNPDRKEDIKRIELWRVKIRHPGDGCELCCEAVEVLSLDPWSEGDRWPVPIDPQYPFYRM